MLLIATVAAAAAAVAKEEMIRTYVIVLANLIDDDCISSAVFQLNAADLIKIDVDKVIARFDFMKSMYVRFELKRVFIVHILKHNLFINHIRSMTIQSRCYQDSHKW